MKMYLQKSPPCLLHFDDALKYCVFYIVDQEKIVKLKKRKKCQWIHTCI